MNKYITSTLVVAALVAATAAPVFADESSSPSPSPSSSPRVREDQKQRLEQQREEQKQRLEQEREAQKQRLEQQREAQKQRLEQEREDRITSFWKKTGERLQKLISREGSVYKKIDERLKKLEEAGKNTAAQRALLVIADTKIKAAQTALTTAIGDAELAKLIADNKPMSEITARIRVLHKGVLAAIRDAHKALVDVIVSTRGMSTTPTPTATP